MLGGFNGSAMNQIMSTTMRLTSKGGSMSSLDFSDKRSAFSGARETRTLGVRSRVRGG